MARLACMTAGILMASGSLLAQDGDRPGPYRPAWLEVRDEAAPPAADESLSDPRLGGPKGKSRYRVTRASSELVDTPDVVVLKDGTQLEAYFLESYEDWIVFWVKETGTSWLKEQVPRDWVKRIDFEQYLERDPVEPRSIEPARKQPVPKDEVLSGVFSGTRGRYTRWRMTFRSEVDKFREHSEDATEYGSVEVESEYGQPARTGDFVHRTKTRASYYLYAPGTVRNKEWVLALSEVVHSEVDRSPVAGWSTQRIPDETFILHFGPDRESFWLEWSNLGGRAWSSPVQVTFERVDPAPPSRPSGPPRDRGVESPPPARRARAPADARPRVAAGRAAASSGRPGFAWQVDSWGPPATFWNGRVTR